MAPSDSLVSWDSASSLSQAPSPYFGKQHDAKRDELAAVLEAIQACKPADLQTKVSIITGIAAFCCNILYLLNSKAGTESSVYCGHTSA